MTLEENIRAILECNFTGYKDEIIEVATKRIMEQISRQKPIVEELEKIREEIEKMRSKQNCSCSDCLDILDNHISELKGE